MTTSEPALPEPLAEAGTIRRLGAEILEYPVAPGDAIVGARVRDLGLPRDAVVNVIVRGDEAIPPRGSTRLREGDQVHVLLRQSRGAARPRARRALAQRPDRPAAAAQAPVARAARRCSRRGRGTPSTTAIPAEPEHVRGSDVVAQLRIRRDERGGLWVLEDGRYAITGPVAAIGGSRAVSEWARRRIPRAAPDERAWLQTVIGALASDVPE